MSMSLYNLPIDVLSKLMYNLCCKQSLQVKREGGKELQMLTGKITLTPGQQTQFENLIKRGILKQLHSEGMLTDQQLSLALSDIQHQAHAPDDNRGQAV